MISAIIGAAQAQVAAMEAAKGLYCPPGSIDMLYGWSSLRLGDSHARIAHFPRSEFQQDAIMIRRVNARRQLKRQRYTHIAVAVITAPVAVIVILKAWSLAVEWLLQ